MPRTSSAERARTMLALLQHLEPDSDLALDELAERLGSTPEQVAEDVTTLSMCGVAPYDPGDLVSAYVDEGRVHVFAPPPALDRRVRLSAGEARALLSALQAAGFDAGSDLARQLAEASTPDFSPAELQERLRTTSPLAREGVYAAIAHATATSSVVRITYQGGGESDAQEREIEPVSLISERGAWYASAYCRTSRGMRTFRLDRMKNVDPLDERFDPDAHIAATAPFSSEGLPVARVSFADGSRFSERDWPGATVSDRRANGAITVDVPFAGFAWITRQVCAGLGEITVEGPPELREAVAETARTIVGQLEP